MDQATRIVLTGGPGFGKTTIISALEEMGYRVKHEVAREVIKKLRNQHDDLKNSHGLEHFSHEVLLARIDQYHEVSEGITFFDRGLPDIGGFLNKPWSGAPPFLRSACIKHPYHNRVFFTPPWPEIFTSDAERLESLSEAIRVHDNLMQCYEALGYELVEVPHAPIKARVMFILDQVSEWYVA